MSMAVLSFHCGGARPPPAAKEAALVPKACEALGPVVTLSAGDRLNSGATGAARPVQVRVYQLKTDVKLRTATFEDIWQNDTVALQGDLVKSAEQTIFPSETKTIKLEPNAEARLVATVALFREPQGKTWFVSHDLAAPSKGATCPTEGQRILVWLDRMQIEDGQGRVPAGGN
ncbi:MAG TPA: type VI secretion system lipoprotein TssJ [Polyangiaceae bacterium]|nr:type VI secretion system lipoprotein TssJ [Polyangiaceae bacterium]